MLSCSIWAIQDHKDPLHQTPNLTCRTKARCARSSSTTYDPKKRSQYHSKTLSMTKLPSWITGVTKSTKSTSPKDPKILALVWGSQSWGHGTRPERPQLPVTSATGSVASEASVWKKGRGCCPQKTIWSYLGGNPPHHLRFFRCLCFYLLWNHWFLDVLSCVLSKRKGKRAGHGPYFQCSLPCPGW